MKTILKLFKPVLSVIAVMLIGTVAIAQQSSVTKLTAAKNELLSFISKATQTINNPSVTANMTPAQISAFQAKITQAQQRLAQVNTSLAQAQALANMQVQQAQRNADRQTVMNNQLAMKISTHPAPQNPNVKNVSRVTQLTPPNSTMKSASQQPAQSTKIKNMTQPMQHPSQNGRIKNADQQPAQAATTIRNESQQNQQLVSSPHAPGSIAGQPVVKTNLPHRVTVEPSPDYPNMMPLFQSTGNALQDAQIVRDWLVNNPYLRK